MANISVPIGNQRLRFVARDPEDPRGALLYWLGATEPVQAANFFELTQRFSPLIQVVFPDERPGAFVNLRAVRRVLRQGSLDCLYFLDGSRLDVWSGANCTDLCNLHLSRRHVCR
jgi:hypothetical protein